MPTITPPSPFALADHEKRDPLWGKIRAHLTDKLDDARLKNDGDLSETKTAFIRGRIKLLKELISLGESAGHPTGE